MREMKDSGILWIGEIPKEWEIQKAKWIFKERNEKGNSIVLQLLSPSQKYGVVPQSELDSVVKVKEDTDLSTFKTIHAGDYCISLRSFQGGFEYSTYEGVVSPAYHVFYANGRICDLYYKFLFKCVGFIEKIASLPLTLRDGKNISFSMFGNMLIPMPPLCDQQIISTYLDTKCTKIDSIIEKQEKVIEKLKEYKLSVITEAVTKGLNSDVKMKDSGVEWIGEIPEHWGIVKLKKLYQEVKNAIKVGPFGSQLKTGDYVPDGYWVYNQRVILDKNFNFNDTFISESKYESLKGFAVEAGDILITTRGTGTTGHIVQVPNNHPKGILHPCVMKFKLDESLIHYNLLFYIFEYSAYIREQINIANNTSSLPVLYSYTLNNLLIAVPPISEQQQITNYLDKKCSAIDKSIEQKQAIIEKLKEYKKSLIYEVVTGKKEV